MNRAERYAARCQFLELRATGFSWAAAAAAAGLPIKRTAAFLLERWVQREGTTALFDRRAGQPTKLQADVRLWLETTCRAHPDYSGLHLQQELATHFGRTVSVSQINRCRARLGLRYQPPKKRSRPAPTAG